MPTFSLAFIAFIVLATATEAWLAVRQARHVRNHRGAVPARFAASISLAAHQKAADYTLARLRVGRWAGLWAVAVLLAWTLGGGLDGLDRAAHALGLGGPTGGVAVMLAFPDGIQGGLRWLARLVTPVLIARLNSLRRHPPATEHQEEGTI